MNKIEHIGIAVKDLERSNRLFTKLLGKAPYKTETVDSEGVTTSFFQLGNLKIELLSANSPDSPIARFIAARGEGIHHLAFAVNDVSRTMEQHKANDFLPVYPSPHSGADGKMVNFLHPKSTNGVLIEVCQ